MQEERLNKLEASLADILDRLQKLEGKNKTAAVPQVPKPQKIEYNSAPVEQDLSKLTMPARELPQSKPSGGVWLASVGIFFFILAASFFIKLAIDSGWLTPARQLFGAMAFGFALITAGATLRSKDVAYATFLPAAGLVILFLSVFGGHLYWELYSELLACFYVALVSLYALYLFRKFQHEFFLIASTCGSFAVPLLLTQRFSNPFDSCAYFIAWDLMYSLCAIWLGQRLLIGLTAYLSLQIWFLLFEHSQPQQSLLLAAAGFQAGQFLLLSAALLLFSVRTKKPLTEGEAWLLAPCLLLFYGLEYSLLDRSLPNLAPWISLGFGLFLFGLYSIAKTSLKKESLASEPVVLSFLALTLFHALYLRILPDQLSPCVGVLLLILFAWLPSTRIGFDRFWPLYFLIGLVIVAEYLKAIPNFYGMHSSPLAFNFIFFGLLFFGYCSESTKELRGPWLLSFALLQIMVGLDRLIALMAERSVQHYLTSGVWAALGLGMLLFAQSRKDSLLARSSLFIFALVSIKVLLFDIDSNASIARIAALVVIGGLLYAAGLFWRRTKEWSSS